MSELVGLGQGDARRFRDGDDWFVVSRRADLVTTRIGATAERVVDLWHALTVHLDPGVDVHVHDVRTGRTWRGAWCALPELREAIGRLRLSLAAYGGVEISVFTDTDQLSLSAEMLLVIYSRTDRWAFLLDSMGLVERASMPAPAWIPTHDALRSEPQLEQALQVAVERLRLEEITT